MVRTIIALAVIIGLVVHGIHQFNWGFTRDTNVDFLLPSEGLVTISSGKSILHCSAQCIKMSCCVAVSFFQDVCYFHFTTSTVSSASVPISAKTFILTTDLLSEGYTCIRCLNWCYKFYLHKLNWTGARQACTDDGAELLIIDSEEKQNIISAQFSNFITGPRTYFTGMNDIGSEGIFTNLEGTPLVYFVWNHNQPNDYNNQDCVAVKVDTVGWFDDDCSDRRRFICEKTF